MKTITITIPADEGARLLEILPVCEYPHTITALIAKDVHSLMNVSGKSSTPDWMAWALKGFRT